MLVVVGSRFMFVPPRIQVPSRLAPPALPLLARPTPIRDLSALHLPDWPSSPASLPPLPCPCHALTHKRFLPPRELAEQTHT